MGIPGTVHCGIEMGISAQRVDEEGTRWYHDSMKTHGSVSHSRSEETPEAKARWFRSLPMSERMEMLCSFTDLALSANPSLQERKHVEPVAGRI